MENFVRQTVAQARALEALLDDLLRPEEIAAEIRELRESKVGQSRIRVLYPWDLAEPYSERIESLVDLPLSERNRSNRWLTVLLWKLGPISLHNDLPRFAQQAVADITPRILQQDIPDRNLLGYLIAYVHALATTDFSEVERYLDALLIEQPPAATSYQWERLHHGIGRVHEALVKIDQRLNHPTLRQRIAARIWV